MKYIKVDGGYILRFSKDEKLMEGLLSFISDKKIKAGWLSGLGATSGAELGFYDLEDQEYQWHTKLGLSEITNLTGNIAWQDDLPVAHIHVTLTGGDLQAFGGHLKELVVAGTAEIRLEVFSKNLERSYDDTVGLNLLDL